MSGLKRTLQVALSARLLATPAVTALVGQRVFAENQTFPEGVLRQITFGPAQLVPRYRGCVDGHTAFLTTNSWARGPDCTLVAGDIDDAVQAALATPLVLPGFVVSGQYFESSRPVGDPEQDVQHIVSVFRLLTRPAD